MPVERRDGDTTLRRLVEILVALGPGRPVTARALRERVPLYREREAQWIAQAWEPDKRDKEFQKLLGSDLDHLQAAGVRIDRLTEGLRPSTSVDLGRAGAFQLRGSLAMPEIALDEDELAALAIAVRAWSGRAAASWARSAETVGRAGSARPAALPASTGTIWVNDTDAELVDAVASAVQEHETLAFMYRAPGRTEGQRFVDPWGMVRAWGRSYLVGHDRVRAEPRAFRVSRLADAVRAVPGERGCPRGPFTTAPPGTDLVEHLVSAVPARPARLLSIPATADALIDELGEDCRPVGLAPDGRTELELRFWDLEWSAGVLRQYGPGLQVVEPQDLRDCVLEGLRLVEDDVAQLLSGAR